MLSHVLFVAHLPRLQSFSSDLRLDFSMLAMVLEGATKLTELSLHFQLREEDRDGDITTLTKAIQKHPSLQTITIESSFYDPEFDRNLDPLLDALTDLPTLRSLSLYSLKCSPTAFSRIFQCRNLHSLEVSNTSIITPRQVRLLQRNQSLQTLIAPLHRGTEAAWGELVEHNTSLEKLMLVVETCPNLTNCNRNALLPVAKALAMNTSLQSLTFDVNENLTTTSASSSHEKEPELGPSLVCMQAIATSIAKNHTLKSLRIGHCSERIRQNTHNILQHLVNAVQTNYTLTCLELRTGSCCSRRLELPEIDFLLRSNRTGRGEILRGFAFCPPIVDYIVQHRLDINIVYHILLEKPEMIQSIG